MTRVGPWVQPDDIWTTVPTRFVVSAVNGGAVPVADFPQQTRDAADRLLNIGPVLGTLLLGTSVHDGGGLPGEGSPSLTAQHIMFSASDTSPAYDLPTPEEKEAAGAISYDVEGVSVLTGNARITGNIAASAGGGVTNRYGGQVRRIAAALWNPAAGFPLYGTRWYTPGELNAGEYVSSWSAATTSGGGNTFQPVDGTFTLDADGGAHLVFQYDPIMDGSDFAAADANQAASFLFSNYPVVEYESHPPRWRYIFAGRTPIRGRQRASGVIGTIPLRGRQGDKWGLRGRQNSNL